MQIWWHEICTARASITGGENMSQQNEKPAFPPQHQAHQPGSEAIMIPRPKSSAEDYKGSGKLEHKVALITGGDSGIGRATAIAFAKEGADIAIAYFDEHQDAEETKRLVQQAGRRCIAVAGDVGDADFCRLAVASAIEAFGRLDILVNNAAEQHPQEKIEDITDEQLEKTFRTNVFAMFYATKAALPHLKPGARIINTTSVTAYRGSAHLLDYASTKGAIVAFTRSLSQQLVDRQINVNAVAPGPIWTPLIPASFSAEEASTFGSDVPLGRAGQPDEVAPSYVFLASSDASYMTGQVLHPNGGEVINT
jgi:NAD(P)-dependent dehydrogenase (short-subunit alcohol dehydrogenase family)